MRTFEFFLIIDEIVECSQICTFLGFKMICRGIKNHLGANFCTEVLTLLKTASFQSKNCTNKLKSAAGSDRIMFRIFELNKSRKERNVHVKYYINFVCKILRKISAVRACFFNRLKIRHQLDLWFH